MNDWKVAKVRSISDTLFEIEFIDGQKCTCRVVERDGRRVAITLISKEYVEEKAGVPIDDDFTDYVLEYVGDGLDFMLSPIYKNLDEVLWAGIEEAAEKYNVELPG